MMEKQKVIADSVFDESLPDQIRKPPKDYNPPKQEQGEPLPKYMVRLDEFM